MKISQLTGTGLMIAFSAAQSIAAPITPLLEEVPSAVPDQQDFQIPDRGQLSGWLGTCLEKNRWTESDFRAHKHNLAAAGFPQNAGEPG
jgi:hypothetical protein